MEATASKLRPSTALKPTACNHASMHSCIHARIRTPKARTDLAEHPPVDPHVQKFVQPALLPSLAQRLLIFLDGHAVTTNMLA